MNQRTKAPKRTPVKGERAVEILSFMALAYKDYLGARVLLFSALPIQGATLASTAVEKYFKAIIAFRGNRAPGHLRQAHFRSIKNFDPGLYAALNHSFLALLQKCYRLRYLEGVKPGFNLAIFARELLAELDYTVNLIEQRFDAARGDTSIKTAYGNDVARHDARLYRSNHVLLGIDKQAFIALDVEHISEIRYSESIGMLEVFYTAEPGPTDGNFMREGLQENPSGGNYFSRAPKDANNQGKA